MCLEFSHVTVPGLRELYDAYSMNVIPTIGRCSAACMCFLVEVVIGRNLGLGRYSATMCSAMVQPAFEHQQP